MKPVPALLLAIVLGVSVAWRNYSSKTPASYVAAKQCGIKYPVLWSSEHLALAPLWSQTFLFPFLSCTVHAQTLGRLNFVCMHNAFSNRGKLGLLVGRHTWFKGLGIKGQGCESYRAAFPSCRSLKVPSNGSVSKTSFATGLVLVDCLKAWGLVAPLFMCVCVCVFLFVLIQLRITMSI